MYEPTLKDDAFFGSGIIRDLDEFAKKSDLIVCNRWHEVLKPYEDKVFARDLYKRD